MIPNRRLVGAALASASLLGAAATFSPASAASQVAIGVTEESTATITDNELSRIGGQPPILAVKDGSTATIHDNRITGGGVAAVLVQGKATVSGNTFVGVGAKQGNAVWVWENSTATISDNSFDGYRAAVNATKANVVISGNTIKQFQGTAIFVKDSQKPAHVYGNTATSADAKAKAVNEMLWGCGSEMVAEVEAGSPSTG